MSIDANALSMSELLRTAVADLRGERSGEPTGLPQTSFDPDPDRLGVAVFTADGRGFSAGDADALFTIQSMSKAFTYGMALQEHGFAAVDRVVDVEPSGEGYGALSLEDSSHRPDNPMINAGAIVVHSLLGGTRATAQERDARVLDTFSRLAGRELAIDEGVFEAEMASSDRNLGIAHMLHSVGALEEEAHEAVRGYVRQCAVSVTVRDLAVMAATLADGGRQPVTGKRIFDPAVCRQVLSVMMTCGMYESAGDWVSEVGIPAKSGVSGGIIGAVPGRGGIAVHSPRLDEEGNSVRGQKLFEHLSDELGLHFVEALHEEDLRWERAIERG